MKPRGKYKLSGNGVLNNDDCMKIENICFYFGISFYSLPYNYS